MPTAILSPNAKQQFFTDGSTVAAGYRLHTYLANSANVPAETYRDRAGTVPNTNPIILDARGEATIYLQPGVVYDYVLRTEQGTIVWTREDVTAEAGDANAVTFTQAGVGAVQTDVQTKLRRMEVNAEDFGLAADGAADDTATLEKLISFAGANGRRLILPEGTSSAPRIIRINRPLTIPAGMAANWLGGGADKTIIRLSAASLTNDMIAFVGAPKGVHIRGIRFDQSGATTSLSWGTLAFQNAEDVEVAYCEFLNFDRAGLVFNGCRGWSVHHNHFVRSGAASPASSTNEAFLVSDSAQAVRDGDFSFNRLEGSAIDVAGSNLDIHHNDISGWGFGAGVTIEQTVNTHTNSIRSNRIHNSLAVIDSNGYRPGGIENWGYSSEISNNEIFSCAGAGMDQGGSGAGLSGTFVTTMVSTTVPPASSADTVTPRTTRAAVSTLATNVSTRRARIPRLLATQISRSRCIA